MYLHERPDELAQLVTDAAAYFSRAEPYIVKDYYAMVVLREAIARNPRFVFKGGTCLSKCHHAINRFSEDIDLGMTEEHATEGMRKAMKRAVTEAVEAIGLEIVNLDQTRSKREFNRYDIALPGGRGDGLLIVETAVITPAFPAEAMPVQSFIDEYLDAVGLHDISEEYSLGPFEVMANSMERTLCDKVYAVCDYYLADDPIPTRQSRHIYDLRKLQGRVAFDDGLADLFKIVRGQRLGKNRCPSANPGIDLAAVLREIAENGAYERDYVDVTEKLLYDEMPYGEVVKVLSEIAEFLNGIDWDA